ncbi:MAG TPA: acyl carrier protein [Erysipelotrichaceae bacterium]|nr:acyl carrier protein [Erysipelotrichaceae bacterium]
MDYFDKIKEALADKLNGKELTMDSSFKDLGIDSLDLVDLVFALEEEIGTTFEDDELLSIKTVKDLCDLIDRKTKKGALK